MPDDTQSMVNALSQPDQAAMQPETFVNPMVKALMGGMAANVAKPAQLTAPNPYLPGSEENSWYEDQRAKSGADWAARTAVGLMGGGMPMAKPGAVGMAGGKLIQGADKALGPEEELQQLLDFKKSNDVRGPEYNQFNDRIAELQDLKYKKKASEYVTKQRENLSNIRQNTGAEDNVVAPSPTGEIDNLIGKYNSGGISDTEKNILKTLLKDRYKHG